METTPDTAMVIVKLSALLLIGIVMLTALASNGLRARYEIT